MTLGILRFLRSNNFNFMTVGYEELTLYPDFMLRKICAFLDVEYEPGMMFPENTKSHIIEGNAARGDSEKRAGIRYDARRFTSLPIVFYSFCIAKASAFNVITIE